MSSQHPKLAAAVKRFRDEVYAHADTIDPDQNHDWNDLVLGFMLACGVPREELSWGLLSELSCGHFDKYLGEPLTPDQQWVAEVFAKYPRVITVRLGYGWQPGFDQGPIVWVDFVSNKGEHAAASQDSPLINVPDNVIQWVSDHCPLGEFKDYGRDP